METNKIVRLYSNDSKKSRLKRRKNKFQRIWDAEKQTYVKVRKAKFQVKNRNVKKEENIEIEMKAVKRRIERRANPKPAPTKKVEKRAMIVNAKPMAKPIKKPITKPVCIRLYNIDFIWDSETLRYKKAA